MYVFCVLYTVITYVGIDNEKTPFTILYCNIYMQEVHLESKVKATSKYFVGLKKIIALIIFPLKTHSNTEGKKANTKPGDVLDPILHVFKSLFA